MVRPIFSAENCGGKAGPWDPHHLSLQPPGLLKNPGPRSLGCGGLIRASHISFNGFAVRRIGISSSPLVPGPAWAVGAGGRDSSEPGFDCGDPERKSPPRQARAANSSNPVTTNPKRQNTEHARNEHAPPSGNPLRKRLVVGVSLASSSAAGSLAIVPGLALAVPLLGLEQPWSRRAAAGRQPWKDVL